MSNIPAIDPNRKNNADLIADVAQLGYLDGAVLDLTYNEGKFWKKFRPEDLTTNDGDPQWGTDLVQDFCHTGLPDNSYDAVVFDPPYRMNGTPDLDFDVSYGISTPTRWQDRIKLIEAGTIEACRLSRKYVLVKCQAQVVSGKVVWQDVLVIEAAGGAGATLIDRFDLVTSARPQPGGRRQVHARRNHSTLLVLKVKV